MTQKEALNFCKNDLQVPAHLVEINSVEENNAIQAEINRREDNDDHIFVWFGIIVYHWLSYLSQVGYHGREFRRKLGASI